MFGIYDLNNGIYVVIDVYVVNGVNVVNVV